MLRLALIAVPALACGLLIHCSGPAYAQNTATFPRLGEIVRLDPKLDALLAQDAVIEVLGAGFEWSEGPVWVASPDRPSGGFLLFSDVPRNTVYQWEFQHGVSPFLKPSGYTGSVDYGKEPGSNGLTLDPQGRLVSCEHGDRRVSVLTANGGKRTLVDNYRGRRLNSPNDACFKSNGDLYFTDPPYGLPQQWDDPRRELDFCGVYRLELGRDGEHTLTLLTDEMTRPNGLAFSPDEKFLYVAQSDPQAALWRRYPVQADGTLGAGSTFFEATSLVGQHKGLPDGLKVDRAGNVWATGPGGVWIFDSAGKPLGRIATGEATANCCWGDDGSTLYITADMWLCRVRTLTAGPTIERRP